ncbi:MAG TPA: hypothetical protein VFQ37_01770 [Mycobacterium sp.]|nr:hypothetical protein [Mycobacterium sp.]
MEPDNLAERVTVLETGMRALAGRVRASEQDAAAARVLAGAADRDVSEFRDEVRDFRRATVSSLSALREDMNDGFRRVDEKFVHVDNGFIELRGKLDAAAAGQQHIVELIQGLTGNQGAGGSAGRAED